jgi:hypothetical protein
MTEKTTRTELFAALQALAEAVPQMRLGQLVAAIGEFSADLHGRGLWDAEDTELLEAVWRFYRNFEAATAPPDSSVSKPIAAPGLGSEAGVASPQSLPGGPQR